MLHVIQRFALFGALGHEFLDVAGAERKSQIPANTRRYDSRVELTVPE
jgi:hypothetical protein